MLVTCDLSYQDAPLDSSPPWIPGEGGGGTCGVYRSVSDSYDPTDPVWRRSPDSRTSPRVCPTLPAPYAPSLSTIHGEVACRPISTVQRAYIPYPLEDHACQAMQFCVTHEHHLSVARHRAITQRHDGAHPQAHPCVSWTAREARIAPRIRRYGPATSSTNLDEKSSAPALSRINLP